jgi:hypothetical protein
VNVVFEQCRRAVVTLHAVEVQEAQLLMTQAERDWLESLKRVRTGDRVEKEAAKILPAPVYEGFGPSFAFGAASWCSRTAASTTGWKGVNESA